MSVESHEELRVVEQIRSVVRERRNDKDDPILYAEWDCVDGLQVLTFKPSKIDDAPDIDEVKPVSDSKEPAKCMGQIHQLEPDALCVIKDIHPFIENPVVCRKIRNILGDLRKTAKAVIFISPRMKIPNELAKEIQQVEFALPTRDDLQASFHRFVDESIRAKPEYKKLKLEDSFVSSVAESAMGMTDMEANDAFSLSYTAVKRSRGKLELDAEYPRRVFEEKIITLRNSALEYMPTTTGFEAIGGLDNLKKWAMLRRQGFEEPARKIRLPYPKGALLAGIKGVGKTVTAMAIAKEFGFPLFKLDAGKLFASKVGESEAITREVIKIMDGIGRAVVLLDEIEKSFNTGSTSGSGDSGVSSRMFGSLISWLSLKVSPVFLIGTLNNHENIPPELLRKGRFDEIWWCDLPVAEERAAIFKALLTTRYKPQKWSGEIPDGLLEACRDFTGAEIEAAIHEALYASLVKTGADFDTLLVEACEGIQPQAQLFPERLKEMRDKATSFKSASSAVNTEMPVALLPLNSHKRGKRVLTA